MTLKRSPMPPRKAPMPCGSRPTGILAQASHQAIAKRKTRKCAICRLPFEPRNMAHKACGPTCAEKHAFALKAKEERKAAKAVRIAAKVERETDKARLIELKPLKWWRKKAKTSMHNFVRARDEGKPCASCDTLLLKLGRMGGDYDAGHFRPVGLAKHLEFDIRNIWGQCKYCNDRLRGNFQAYEQRLRLREGDAFVDELLADNEPRHLKIHDYQEIEAHYKQELKLLKGNDNDRRTTQHATRPSIR